MSALLHIASFVVHHRPEIAATLDRALLAMPGAELARREGGRSIVLCEGEDESALVSQVESLRELDGVIGVSLVYHHAESAESLREELPDEHAS